MSIGAILGQTKVATGSTTYTNEQILNQSDATLIGLTGNPVPADMFHTLATVGDLYAWRRTVTYQEEVPASYELSSPTALQIVYVGISTEIHYSDSIVVSDDGVVSLSGNIVTTTISDLSGANSLLSRIKGKYFYKASNSSSIWFANSNSEILNQPPNILLSNSQSVIGKAKIPKGTCIDYPVSVNPNAYQTGSDAKPAGYTLGEVQSGTVLSDSSGGGYYYVRYSDSVSVSDDGTVSLGENVTTGNFSLTNDGFVSICNTNVVGKFCKFCKDGSAEPNEVYYIPKGAIFSNYASSLPYTLSVSRYQPVTGYPAIPAGTTIEYLGKLGDKSRMQIVSYVGTGAYGASNPCSITADFPIKSATFLGATMPTGDWYTTDASQGTVNAVSSVYSQEYKKSLGFSNNAYTGRDQTYGKISADKKTLNWYNLSSAQGQLNVASYTYYFLCRG